MSNQNSETIFQEYAFKAIESSTVWCHLKEKHPDMEFPRVAAQIQKFKILADFWRDMYDMLWDVKMDEKAKYQPDPNDYWSDEYEQD